MLLKLALLALTAVSAFAEPHPDPQAHTDHVFEGAVEALGRFGLVPVLPASAPSPPAKIRRSLDLEERAVARNPKAASSAAYYSALVAVGASYTGSSLFPFFFVLVALTGFSAFLLPLRADNAHPRSSEYAGSLRDYYPYNKYGGRYSNGDVAVQYMVEAGLKPALKQQSGGVTLLDCASPSFSLCLLPPLYTTSSAPLLSNFRRFPFSPSQKPTLSFM
jgi:hypothetical protein